MDDPISQAGDVANGMLDPLTVANFTEKYWTQDCRLVHPQMCFKGQKAVYMAYKLWGVLNSGKARWKTSDIGTRKSAFQHLRDTAIRVVACHHAVHLHIGVCLLHICRLSTKPVCACITAFVAAAIDQKGNHVMMHGDSNCCLFGVPCFQLNWYVILTLEDDSRRKLIKQQDNHLLIAETFVYRLPLVGSFFQSTLPRVSALYSWLVLAFWSSEYVAKYMHTADHSNSVLRLQLWQVQLFLQPFLVT